MTSSSTYIEALPTVTTRAKRLPLTPDEAAAVIAGNQLNRTVRILGPSNPGAFGGAAPTIAQSATVQAPINNPILTVNSSINSVGHIPAVAQDGVAGGAIVVGTTAASGVTAASTVTGSTSTLAGTTALSPAITPTAAALPTTVGTAAATPATTALTPTVAASSVPTPTPSSSGMLATGAVSTTRVGTATAVGTARTNATTTATSPARTATATATRTGMTANVANPVRITQDASGKVVVSNARSQK